MSDQYDKRRLSNKMETAFDWMKWIDEIPYLNFPSDWCVQIMPPFGGALVRFAVSTYKMKNRRISVYLDCYDLIGYYGKPYWEIYPYEEDTFRCKMNDTNILIEHIQKAIDEMEAKGAES